MTEATLTRTRLPPVFSTPRFATPGETHNRGLHTWGGIMRTDVQRGGGVEPKARREVDEVAGETPVSGPAWIPSANFLISQGDPASAPVQRDTAHRSAFRVPHNGAFYVPTPQRRSPSGALSMHKRAPEETRESVGVSWLGEDRGGLPQRDLAGEDVFRELSDMARCAARPGYVVTD